MSAGAAAKGLVGNAPLLHAIEIEEALLCDPFNGDPPSRRKDSELNRVLSILDELACERGNG